MTKAVDRAEAAMQTSHQQDIAHLDAIEKLLRDQVMQSLGDNKAALQQVIEKMVENQRLILEAQQALQDHLQVELVQFGSALGDLSNQVAQSSPGADLKLELRLAD